MTDLVEFLRARLAEDKQAARVAAQNLGEAMAWAVRGTEVIVPLQAAQDPRHPGMFTVVRAGYDDGQPVVAHIARHDPARVLADAEAKRRIIDEHEIIRDGVDEGEVLPSRESGDRLRFGCRTCHIDDRQIYDGGYCPTLRLLALPYADHPDYRPEWRLDK